MTSPVRRRTLVVALAVLATAAAAVTTTAAAVGASPAAAAAPAAGSYYVLRPSCNAPAAPGQARCFAIKRVHAASSRTAGARRASELPDGVTAGPAGGYTPADLATAYGYNRATATTQTVAIIDAYDDPNALADLNQFDARYGLPAETATSFRKVSQTGSAAPADLPAADTTGWSTEISLDVDAVRAVCTHCKILLVEADESDGADLAKAVNTAVRLGATEVSNSYGSPENDPGDPDPALSAYNHPGVVITASTGDDGYFDWDNANYGFAASPPAADTQVTSSDRASAPATYPTVVAVGGTTLQLNDDGTRSGESVWNDNGITDATGYYAQSPQGASGGGCSAAYTAQKWQYSVANYAQAACGTKRLAADISALADPATGFDVYDSYQVPGVNSCTTNCWSTYGGTSLASPLIAAMWGLAGGSGGVKYPSLSLYGHARSAPSSVYDVTVGGNGFCAGAPRGACAASFGGSPNGTGLGVLDCGWTADGSVSSGTRACDAASGYDGPSGVGTPKGLSMFRALTPTARIGAPTVTHARSARFSAATSTDPFPGGTISTYTWSWGDRTSSSGSSPSHTYARKATYTVTLKVTDNYGRSAVTTRRIAVK